VTPTTNPLIRSVLVVDDDRSIRQLLTRVLDEAGYDVISAADGSEAMVIARHAAFDLVITDLAMPETDGIELIRNFRAEYPGIRIIAISGAFSSEIMEAARLLGAAATLRKPLMADELLNCIRHLS
jgi:DNA-binding response OmpR family regulator